MISSILPTYNRAPLTFVKGEGSWLVEADGRRFLDMAAGIAVMSLGHGHPAVVSALCNQAENLWHTSNLYQIEGQQILADKLVAHTAADTVFFTNSGTESCELAIKMARKYFHARGEDRTEIVAFSGSFHGRSSAGIAAAGSSKMTEGFGPLLPGFTHLDIGDHDGLREAITDKTCAVIVEPVLGEGGIIPVPEQCLKGLRDLCDTTGTLLILDEVQCGVGRTGKLFAHEWSGITPDIMMVAKGIGSGFPLGCVLATENAARGMSAGTHGSTYGGNPLGCAVANAVIDIIAQSDFLDEVERKGVLLKALLDDLVFKHSSVFELARGVGLMVGLKCKLPVGDVLSASYAQQLLAVPAGDNTLRLLPALTVTDLELEDAVARLDCAASSLSA